MWKRKVRISPPRFLISGLSSRLSSFLEQIQQISQLGSAFWLMARFSLALPKEHCEATRNTRDRRSTCSMPRHRAHFLPQFLSLSLSVYPSSLKLIRTFISSTQLAITSCSRKSSATIYLRVYFT